MTNLNLNFEFKITPSTIESESIKIIHHKSSRKNKIKLSKLEYEETKIVWTLSIYKKNREYDGIEWQYQSASNKLGNGVTAFQILKTLNSENRFDPFIPNKNDILKIRLEYINPLKKSKSRPYIGSYISYIFNEIWLINQGYDHIDNVYEEIMKGEILIKE